MRELGGKSRGKILDCESTDSIYASLKAITGAERDEIESFLKSIDIESLYRGSSPPRDGAFAQNFQRDSSLGIVNFCLL